MGDFKNGLSVFAFFLTQAFHLGFEMFDRTRGFKKGDINFTFQ